MGNRVHIQTRAPEFPGDFPAVRVVDDYDECAWFHLDPASAGSTAGQWVDQALDQSPEFADLLEQMGLGASVVYLDDADFDLAGCLDRYRQRQRSRTSASRLDQQLPASPVQPKARM